MNFLSAIAALFFVLVVALTLFASGVAVGIVLTERNAARHARSGGL